MVLANAPLIDQFSKFFETMGATWVLWLLIVLSIISVAIMLERLVYFYSHSFGNVEAVAARLSEGDLEGATELVGNHPSLEAEVVRAGIRAAPRGPDSVEEVVKGTIVRDRLGYERSLAFLGTLGNNAPFIGLFGTVLGIIQAFAELAKSTSAGAVSTGSSNVMAGISEALVATAVGLLVALPAVAVFNAYGRWLRSISSRAESLGHALVSYLKAVEPENGPQGSASLPGEKSSVG